jgi:hypothetical protein
MVRGYELVISVYIEYIAFSPPGKVIFTDPKSGEQIFWGKCPIGPTVH